jgi:integrase/recombinase XerD
MTHDQRSIFATSVDAPAGARKIVRNGVAHRLGADICPASDAAIHLPRARMGVRGPGPNQNRGFDALRVIRKGGRREALAINPQAAQRIRAYLEIAGHGDQHDTPLFRPLRGNAKAFDAAGRIDPDAIDRMVRKYAAKIGLDRGYSAHSMRATFITTALENGAQLEDVQKAAGHRDPSTTKLYDRRGYNPEKAASLFATY